MKRLKILTILVVTALGISAGIAYAQFGGGPGAGWGVSASPSGVALNSVPVDTNVKIIRKGQTISQISEGSSVVNVTLAAAYPNNSIGVGNLKVGQKIVISSTTNYNGTFTITVVTDQSHFSYAQTSTGRATETAGTAGGDYSSLTTWDSDGNNTTAECYNDWETGLPESLDISTNTTTSTSYKKIVVPKSERNNGTSGTGFKIAGTVTIGDNYAAIEDVEITGLVTVSSPTVLTINGNMIFGGGLTVASAATLNAGNSNMTVTGTLSLLSGGTINAQGSMMTFKDSTVNFASGTFNPDQASLTFSGTSSWTTPSAPVPQYKTVRFASGTTTISGTPWVINKVILDTGSGAVNGGTIVLFGDLVCNSGTGGTTLINIGGSNFAGNISGPATGPGGILPPLLIDRWQATTYVYGPLTFQNVEVSATAVEFKGGSTFTIGAGKDITVNSGAVLKFTGTGMSNMVRLRSGTPGTQWNLKNAATATITPVYTDVRDSAALNAVTATATGNMNSGNNNANWNFGTNFTWIADTAKNWSDATAWSGGAVPGTTSKVYFTGAHNGDCTLTAPVEVRLITSNGYTGTLSTSAGNYSITINSYDAGLNWCGGTLNANASTIYFKGDLNLSGGTFTPGTSTLQCTGEVYIRSNIPAFNSMNFNPGSYVYMTPGITITLASTSALNAVGNVSSGLVKLRSWINGLKWNIDNTVGTVTATYMDVSSSIASAAIYANSSVDQGNNTNWYFNSGAITAASVVPASLVAGVTGKVTATFTSSAALPANGKIEITFPANFNVSGAGFYQSSIDGTFSASSPGGQTVIITRTGGTSFAANTPLIVTLSNIRNPTSAGLTGTYTITTKDSAGNVLATMSGFPGNTIVANPLSGVTITPGTYTGTGNPYTIAWTSAATAKPASVNIKYSTDSGNTFPNFIAKVTNYTGGAGAGNTYSWIPRSNLGAQVRILVQDAPNAQFGALSSSDISIVAPTITITAPGAGQVWYSDGTAYNITWTPTVFTNPAIPWVRIEFIVGNMDGTNYVSKWTIITDNDGSHPLSPSELTTTPNSAGRIVITALPKLNNNFAFSGNAAGKVSGAELLSGNKILKINVISDFSNGDTLVVSGLKFNNFTYGGTGYLGLDANGGPAGLPGFYDPESQTIQSITISDSYIYSGGYGDGYSEAHN